MPESAPPETVGELVNALRGFPAETPVVVCQVFTSDALPILAVGVARDEPKQVIITFDLPPD